MTDISPELIQLAKQMHQRAIAKRHGNLTARLKDMTGDKPIVLAKGVIVLEVTPLANGAVSRCYHLVSALHHWDGEPWRSQQEHNIAISAVIAAYDRLPADSQPKRCEHCKGAMAVFARQAKYCSDECRNNAYSARRQVKKRGKS